MTHCLRCLVLCSSHGFPFLVASFEVGTIVMGFLAIKAECSDASRNIVHDLCLAGWRMTEMSHTTPSHPTEGISTCGPWKGTTCEVGAKG